MFIKYTAASTVFTIVLNTSVLKASATTCVIPAALKQSSLKSSLPKRRILN